MILACDVTLSYEEVGELPLGSSFARPLVIVACEELKPRDICEKIISRDVERFAAPKTGNKVVIQVPIIPLYSR